MKRALRIIIPFLLVLCILGSAVWYLQYYDPQFTMDTVISMARSFEEMDSHEIATDLYNFAYSMSDGDDEVAIELANHHKENGNYTKAEYTLTRAIADGGSKELYMALCETYIQQDKVLDAVRMLDTISDETIKEELDKMRPSAPKLSSDVAFHSNYVPISTECDEGCKLYVNYEGEYPSIETDLYDGPYTLPGGETTIYAVAVGENSLVSPLTIFAYTVGGVIEEITFADKGMELLTRQILNFNESRPIYTNDLWTIHELTVYGEIKSLEDLKYFPYLERLTITNAEGLDLQVVANLSNLTEFNVQKGAIKQDSLEAIGKLTKLTRLTLTDCSLSTIAPLEKLTELTYLDLGSNTLRNIEPIAAFTKLQELYLSNNAITELDVLSSLKDLKTLELSNNSITTLKPIFSLNQLTTLSANNNGISSLDGIQGLTSLEKIQLKQNALTNISAIGGCSALTEADLSNNAITDITVLTGMTGLLRIDLSHNFIKDLPKFTSEHQLGSLIISHNELSKLDPLSVIPDLYSVDIDYNQKVSKLDPLLKCRHLIQVNCFGTNVTENPFPENQGVVVNFDSSR